MPQPQSPKYRVQLRLGNNTYTKIAPSIVEAIAGMQPEHLTKAKSVLKVSYNKLKAEVVLLPIQARKLFSNKTAQEIFQKRMIGALK